MFHLCVLLVSLLLLLVSSVFLWWSFFLFITIIAIHNLKVGGSAVRSILYYFVVQEVLLLLLIISSYVYFQCLLFLGGSGLSPFHVWLVKILEGVGPIPFIWINTIQKVPYYLLLSSLFEEGVAYLVLVCSVIPFIQALNTSGGLLTVSLILVGSGGFSVVLGYYESSSLVSLVLYLYLLSFFTGWMSSLFSSPSTLEVWLFLLSIPITMPLLLKLISLSIFSPCGGLLLLLILLTLFTGLLVSIVVYFRFINVIFVSKYINQILLVTFVFNLLLLI